MSEVETRISLKCNNCGSHEILLREYSVWHEAEGVWEPDGEGLMFCDECESTSIDISDIPEK